ncbi:Alpha-galactosidase precursor [Lachnospiraceae bacterium TWA4]|nr:Alpha-galactosidase precursor [Lachnospiraceae bacterium TWA4]
MKSLADYIHHLGLKAGIYSEAGKNTCGHYYDDEGDNGKGVGLYGHEKEDLIMYLKEWGYDFIKVDYCGGIHLALDEQTQYTKIGHIIEQIRREEHRPIVYNVCRWQFPGEWVATIADSWRTGGDITPDFESVLYQIDRIKPLRRFCMPGHVNDLDMLQVGNGMSKNEDEAHFAMWCMMSTPLMLGCDLTKISKELIDLVSNEELIAINQDSACLQAFVVKEILSKDDTQCLAEVWVKNLGKDSSNSKAVAFLNRSTTPVKITVTPEELGLVGELKVRDVLLHKDLNNFNFEVEVPAHSCKVYRMEASDSCFVQEISTILPEYIESRYSLNELRKDAILIDVRDTEDFKTYHLEHAIHLPYQEIYHRIKSMVPDIHQEIIFYCNTGKKSSQAARNVFYLGYRNVHFCALYI